MKCRLCGKSEGRLFKYANRHSVHAECGMEQWGREFLDRLYDWQLANFPYSVAKQYGVEHILEQRTKGLRAAK